MLNRDKIINLINSANQALISLKRYETIADEEILHSDEKLGNIKYQLIILIESCIDICNHITSKQIKQIPESYSKCFELLYKYKLINNSELMMKMAEMAKFRNIIVHLYWKVDDIRVIHIMRNDLKHIEEYLRIIAQEIV